MCKKVRKKFARKHNVCIFVKSYEQNYTKGMRVSPQIIEKLINDKNFRLKTALALQVSERNVQILAEKNSDNLTKMAAVMVYRGEGFTDEDIFDAHTIAHNTASSN